MITVNKNEVLSRELDKDIYEINIENSKGETVTVFNYGCIIKSINVMNSQNKPENVVLQYDNDIEYIKNDIFLNSLIGPFAGRIESAQFSIEDKNYKLAKNNGENNLHGGNDALDKKIWDFNIFNDNTIRFTYLSPHLENGFPGNVNFEVFYNFSNDSELSIEYTAVSDEDTVINLTNHSYFNLSGDNKSPIDEQIVFVDSNEYKTVDDFGIPSKKPVDLKNHPFNFSKRKPLNEVFAKIPVGIDNPFMLNKFGEEFSVSKKPLASLYDGKSKRKLDIFTNQECAVVYTSNMPTFYHRGICFEMQATPNVIAPVKKGEQYFNKTIYKFSVE